MNIMYGYAALVCVMILTAFSQILIKKESQNIAISFNYETLKAVLLNGKILLSMFMMALAPALYFISLQFIELNEAYAIYSLIYVMVVILSKIFLNENIGILKLTGISCITIGVLLFL